MDIPLTQIIPPRVLLRLVDRESVEYLELSDSIGAHGFLQPLLVRPSLLRPGFYEIIDGLHRFSVATDLRLETVPCMVREANDEEAMILSLEANALGKDTTPSEYAAQMLRILKLHPEMTLAGLGRVVHKSPRWIANTLLLNRLSEDEQKMVDRGEISLDSAYMLSRTPRKRRKEMVKLAIALDTQAFKAVAAAAIKDSREQLQGDRLKRAYLEEFKERSWLRSLTAMRRELRDEEQMIDVLHTEGCKTMVDGWRAAMRWALHLDKASLELQRALYESRQRGAND